MHACSLRLVSAGLPQMSCAVLCLLWNIQVAVQKLMPNVPRMRLCSSLFVVESTILGVFLTVPGPGSRMDTDVDVVSSLQASTR